MTMYDYDFDRLGGFVAIFSLPGREGNLYFGPFRTLEQYREWYDRVFAGRFEPLPEKLSGVATPLIHPAAVLEWEKPFVEVNSWDEIKPDSEEPRLPFGTTQLFTPTPAEVENKSVLARALRWLRNGTSDTDRRSSP